MRHTVFLSFLLLAISLNLFSQKNFIINLKGGYNVPLADLKGNVYDASDRANTYIMNHGFSFGAAFKYRLLKDQNLSSVLNLEYTLFSNTRENVYNTGQDEDYKINAFVLSAGLEYGFLKNSKITPFIGIDFTGHFFSGSQEVVGIAGDKSKLKLELASRYGFAAGAGINIILSTSLGVTGGVKYYAANLIGKDSSGVTTGKFALNDGEQIYNGETIPEKNISYIQLYTGITFYINKKKK